jgi:hypothetical protein
MKRKYFGTDGIRGRANVKVTAEVALKVGRAAGLAFQRGDHRRRVVIGKDTRLSSYMIESALVAGFTSVGADVLLLGPVPTPAVAMLIRSMRCDLGVMISASHNPYEDNGIKLFGPDGYKVSDEVEARIEALMDGEVAPMLARSPDLGRAKRIEGVQARYIEYAKRTLGREVSLEGVRVVVDCANGAAYRSLPRPDQEIVLALEQIDEGEGAPHAFDRRGDACRRDCAARRGIREDGLEHPGGRRARRADRADRRKVGRQRGRGPDRAFPGDARNERQFRADRLRRPDPDARLPHRRQNGTGRRPAAQSGEIGDGGVGGRGSRKLAAMSFDVQLGL